MNEGQHGALGPPSSLLETSEDEEAGQRLWTSIPRRSPLTHQLLGLQGCTRRLMPSSRRMRQMTPADKKDASYWDKRRKNNEAAKRSRERRRLNDFMLEGQLLALSEENIKLRTEMLWLQYRFSVAKDGQPAQAPLHNLTPSALKPSLWGFRASPSSLLVDKQDLGHLLHASRVSWTGASTSSSIGQNLHTPQSHSIYMEGSSGQPYCLQPRGHERKRACLPSHLQLYEKTPQHPYSRAGGTEPDSTANYQVFSSKGNPSAPEQRSSSKFCPVLPHQVPPSFSASAHLPQSQFQHTLNNPSLCSSLVLPWGNPNVHLSQIYYNLPLYLPLDGRELHNHGLNPQQIFKSRADAFSTEMAHLRRYFLSESC